LKKLCLIVVVLLVGIGVACTRKSPPERQSGQSAAQSATQSAVQEQNAYHIGIVTGTVSQSEDDLRGAEELIRRYGKVSEGGVIQHVTYPDNFMDQMETTITQITALADDPLMKAIVVNQGVPGAAEAFKRIKEKRPDIMLFVGEPHEDPLVIQQAATLAVSADFVSRGYTIIWAAKQLGADTFVHISFPRHMSYESLGLRRQIMEEACNDLGIKFVFVTAPDPTSDVGVAGAQQYILEQTPQWIQTYGANTAFFCTNDAHTEPLLKQLLTYGGLFVEADLPSPLMGYPGALGIDLSAETGDFPAILKKVEEAVIEKGGAGKFGTWAFSYGFSVSAGLGEYAKRILDGTASLSNPDDMYTALGEFTSGAKWNGGYYVDANTGVRARNQILIYMDTYVFGQGYLPTTEQEVPEKYYTIKFNN
jgi:DNA-binding LacI/PurR family transcriptional regulator